MNKKHIQHLYWRAGFGIAPKELQSLEGKSKEEIINALFKSSNSNTPLTINYSVLNKFNAKELRVDRNLRNEFSKLNRNLINTYNHFWINRFNKTNEDLRERMTLFWANHFVVKTSRIGFLEKYNNLLRSYALGDFREFVKKISKAPAMINYLNLNSNRVKSPNENFARELLELFTLGVGNYAENDIKEAAKAFTGYQYTFSGDFKFNKREYNNEEKNFLGKKGNFNGDQIIDIITSTKKCAHFICTKLYKYFVNNNVNQSHVQLMTEVFYKDYNIENIMRYIFSSSWFYETKNIGTKIKSPVDLIVGMQKIIPFQFQDTSELIRLQNVLEQRIFSPPSVAGWDGDKNWINTNTMLYRVKLPTMLLERETYYVKPKGNNFRNLRFKVVKNKHQEKIKTVVDWSYYKDQVKKLDSKLVAEVLFLCEISPNTANYLRSLGKLRKKRNLSKLMSLPEFQMC